LRKTRGGGKGGKGRGKKGGPFLSLASNMGDTERGKGNQKGRGKGGEGEGTSLRHNCVRRSVRVERRKRGLKRKKEGKESPASSSGRLARLSYRSERKEKERGGNVGPCASPKMP